MKFIVYVVITTLIWVLFCFMGKMFNVEQYGMSVTMFYGFVAGGCGSSLGVAFALAMK